VRWCWGVTGEATLLTIGLVVGVVGVNVFGRFAWGSMSMVSACAGWYVITDWNGLGDLLFEGDVKG
jgi:hypothetical protein